MVEAFECFNKSKKLSTKDSETLQKTQAESDKVNGEARESALWQNSWVVKISDINQTTFDLAAKNPNTPEEAPLRSPEEILKEMAELDKESGLLMENLKQLIASQ